MKTQSGWRVARIYRGLGTFPSKVTNHGLTLSALPCGGELADGVLAIMLRPDFANAFVCCGNAKSGKGDNQGAIASYSRAIQLEPLLGELEKLTSCGTGKQM